MSLKLLSTRQLLFLPILFFTMMVINLIYDYFDYKNKMYDFVHKQSQTLNSFMLIHRNYYQQLYLDKTIPLNEESLKGLPAFSSYEISKQFSEQNIFNISVQTVSDRARNNKNQADASELKAINFFKSDDTIEEYFKLEGDYYQYATPLYIKKKCLACHGAQEKAPSFISKRYDSAYNYELGQYEIGNQLVLELVESESIENFQEISYFIDKVKSHGCKIAIDDFGTGYSNFEYLLKLKTDYIKIDGSMIKNIDTDNDAKLVVSTIVDFAKKMNIKTIAEYVETESIEATVKELGIDYSQGYYFSQPSPNIEV